jgi:hypothetical protein
MSLYLSLRKACPYICRCARDVPIFVARHGMSLYLSLRTACPCICRCARHVPIFVAAHGMSLYLSLRMAYPYIFRCARHAPITNQIKTVKDLTCYFLNRRKIMKLLPNNFSSASRYSFSLGPDIVVISLWR